MEPLKSNGVKSRLQRNVDTEKQGNSSSYLCRRLLRDHQEIFEGLKDGKYPSVRAAAKEAGIVKDPTPYDILVKVWNKASSGDRERFLDFIGR